MWLRARRGRSTGAANGPFHSASDPPSLRSECFDSEFRSRAVCSGHKTAGTEIATAKVYKVLPISSTHFVKQHDPERDGAVQQAGLSAPRTPITRGEHR